MEEFQTGPSNAGIQAILDEMASLNNGDNDNETEASPSPLANKLDLDRLIFAGHSMGGRVVLDLVAFDNPFPIVAAFTYGASIVNSGFGFADAQSVHPCNRTLTVPPPLLILGGPRDGVVALGSITGKNATEVLQRSFDEAFKHAEGDTDLLITQGANHMVFSDPLDPTVGAHAKDWTLAEASADRIRDVLGTAICDFLDRHSLPSSTRQSSTEKRNNDAMGSKRIPRSLVHKLDSFRPKSSSTPPFTISDDVFDDPTMESVWQILSKSLEKSIQSFLVDYRLKSSESLPDHCRLWSMGNTTGTFQAWNGFPLVEWAVRYSANDDTNDLLAGSNKSVGFMVWLGTSNAAPPLTVEISVDRNRATMKADHLPRMDMLHDSEYIDTFYGGPFSTAWSQLQKTKGIEPFSSIDPSVRAMQSPNALFLSAETDNVEAIDVLRAALVDHFEHWRVALRKSPANCKLDSATRMSERDMRLRNIVLNHNRAAYAHMPMGIEQAYTLACCKVGLFDQKASMV